MAVFGRCYMAKCDNFPSRDSINLDPFLCFLPAIIHLLQSGHARAKSGISMVDRICRFLHLFCGQLDIPETCYAKGQWIQIICISRFHTIQKTLSTRPIPLFLHLRRNGTEAQAHYRCADLGLRPVDRFTWVKLPATFGQDQQASSLRRELTASHRNDVARCRSLWFLTSVLYYYVPIELFYSFTQNLNYGFFEKPSIRLCSIAWSLVAQDMSSDAPLLINILDDSKLIFKLSVW